MKNALLLVLACGASLSVLAQCNSTDIYNNDTTSAVCFEVDGRVLNCYSNNLPDHDDSYNSPFTVAADDYEYSMCAYPDTASDFTPLYEETETVAGCTWTYAFGVSTNGVKYDPSSAEYFEDTDTGENNIEWHVEARYIFSANFGNNGGHLNPFGEYHYHDVPSDYFADSLGIDGSAHSPIVGYAADGFPIYYKYAYSDADDTSSVITAFESGYKLKSGTRPGDGVSAPDGAYTGLYYEDYEYIDNFSDLDECNGRYGKTPDYPYGTYYYVLTESYPYIPRCFKGSEVDNTFRVGPSASCPSSSASTDCSAETEGCMDPFATNYDPSANSDDGSCTYGFQAVLSAEAVTCADNDGRIVAKPFGGTPPYTFSWSTGAGGPVLSNIGAGTYTVTASDNGGSSSVVSATVEEPDQLLYTATSEYLEPGSGYALAFDGTDDYLDFENDFEFSSHSVSCWIKTTTTSTQTVLQLFYDGNNYIKITTNASGKLIASVAESGSALQTMRSSSAVNDGDWHHIAYTFDASGTGTLNLYIDGTLDNGVAVDSDNLSFSMDARDMHIGANRGETSNFSGSIDELALWDTALSVADLRSNMCTKINSSNANRCNLITYLRFDESSDNKVNDWARGYNGGFVNDPTFEISGAPIGDNATFQTSVSGGSNINLATANGDELTATVTSGSADMMVVYHVEDAPNVDTAPGSLNELSKVGYWGVKLFGSASGVYRVDYDYNGHPGISVEANLGLASRSNNSSSSWTDEATASLDTDANTLTLTGQTGTEFILGSSSGNSLPITLLDFNADLLTDNTVELTWETAAEWNNDYFTIERSEDNRSWTAVDYLAAASDAESGAIYRLTDFNPLAGRSYYRLRQTDFDGASTVSKSETIFLQPEATVSMFPNPTSGMLTIDVGAATVVRIEALDLNGRQVAQSFSTKQIDLTGLPAGVYIVRALSDAGPIGWNRVILQ